MNYTPRQPLRVASDRVKERFGRWRRTEAQQCHLAANMDTPSTVSSGTVFISLLPRHLMCVFSVLTYVETQLGDRLSEESDQFLQHEAVTSSALSVLFPLFGLGW